MNETKMHELFHDVHTCAIGLKDRINMIGRERYLTVQRIGEVNAQGVDLVMWDWKNEEEVNIFLSFANSELVVKSE